MPKPKPNPLIVELCRKFPDAGSRTLARKLFAEHPLQFVTVEKARSAVRRYLGLEGPGSRQVAGKRGTARAPRKPGEMPKLPESVYRAPEPFELDAGRLLVLSDVHLPFADNVALEAALKHGEQFKPHAILLNGDLLDFYQLSRFDKDPTMPKVSAELEAGRQFWNHVRARFPRAKLYFKLGNHDERFTTYIFQAAPLLADIPGIVNGWEEPCGIRANKVTVIGDQRPIMAGKLMILHGHEKGKGIASPVNPARGAFLRLLTSVLEGHSHRQSEHDERTGSGEIIVCRSTGCLCGLAPAYAKFNKWSHGAATVTVEKNGDYQVGLFRIINGKVYQ
jgi:predicted phosphodiesterase